MGCCGTGRSIAQGLSQSNSGSTNNEGKHIGFPSGGLCPGYFYSMNLIVMESPRHSACQIQTCDANQCFKNPATNGVLVRTRGLLRLHPPGVTFFGWP